MASTTAAPDLKPETRPAPLSFLGLACAVGVSSIYFNQPLLLEMAHTYNATPGHAGFVATTTQVGYALGLLLFVPLGDVFEKRALMMRMYAASAASLLLVAVAPSLAWLIVLSTFSGAMASVTHVVLPIAPDLVPESDRGRAIGKVMTGLLLGILLARTFAGWVSHIHGWRYVFVIAALINLAFVPLMARFMPRLEPKQPLRYTDAMKSLWTLWRTQPLLRESAVIAGLLFASFSCFFTTLAFVLHSHYGLGAGVAGTFGLVGAAGALCAPFAGRLSDRRGSRFVVAVGMTLLAGSYLLLWVSERLPMSLTLHIAALALGVIILDAGAQISQVANQTRIFGLVPSARSRINTVYMTVYFGCAAVGSALATVAWQHFQWNGVCGLALAFVLLAAIRHLTGIPSKGAATGIQAPDTELTPA